jgi:hypothetical protein
MKPSQFQTNWFGTLLFVMPLAALSLLATDLTLPVDHAAFLQTALFYSVLFFLLIWGVSTFRARPSGTYLMVGLFFLVLWCFAGIAGTAFVNERFDSSKPETHVVRVLRKYTTHSRTGPVQKPMGMIPAHYAVVTSWKGQGEETISVTLPTYSSIEPNSRLEIAVRRGGLNLEWIEAAKIPKS